MQNNGDKVEKIMQRVTKGSDRNRELVKKFYF